MRKGLELSAKSLMLAGIVLFGVATTPSDAGERHKKYHHITVTTDFLISSTSPSEGNLPSVCDGQVGYWTQIPMPGGKTLCVLHFTEFFKGGSATYGTDQVCEIGKYRGWGDDRHFVVKYTKPGACKHHSGGDDKWSSD